MNRTEVEEIIKKNDIEFIRIEIVDLHGISRIYTTPVVTFLKNEKIFEFQTPGCVTAFKTNSEIQFWTDQQMDYIISNITATPDLLTFKALPWMENTARVLYDLSYPGPGRAELNYQQLSCRQQCKTQIQKLRDMGFQLYSAFEYEFYLVNKDTMKPIYEENNFCAMSSSEMSRPVAYDVMRNMLKVGMEPEIHDTEFRPGQQEITMVPSYGVQSSDNVILYKQIVKDIATQHSMKALFLSKPFPKVAGCSNHFNHSLLELKSGTNPFYDADQPDKMSKIFKNWLAGLQEHAKALTALFCVTTNCFERLKVNSFAPTNDSWGYDNRTTCFRVKNEGPSGTYLESRIPGAASNPYLVMTGCLIAGMDGIKRDLQLKSKPYPGNLYEAEELPEGVEDLPGSMEEAVQCLEKDKILSEELGDVFMKCYPSLKRAEIELWKDVDNDKNVESKWEQYRKRLGLFL